MVNPALLTGSLVIDNLWDAEVVMASWEIPQEMRKKMQIILGQFEVINSAAPLTLGNGSNFGVVTEFAFQGYPVFMTILWGKALARHATTHVNRGEWHNVTLSLTLGDKVEFDQY